MRAAVRREYGMPGEVLAVEEMERPVISEEQVLVRVHASSVNRGDVFALTGKPYPIRASFGLRRPKHAVLGRDVAGTVEAVGTNVTALEVGSEVYGEIDFGGHAEFVAAPASALAPRPPSLTFVVEAAAMPLSGVAALQGIRDAGRVAAGEHVLVNGASGGVGTFAVQIAKALGAEVTGVCHERSIELVRSLGADHVIDASTDDFTRGEARYDLIFDLVGSRSLSAYRTALTPGGRYISSVGRLGWLLKVGLASTISRGRVGMLVARESQSDLVALTELIEAGQVRPAIDRTFPLDETVEAFRHKIAGPAKGMTVIEVVTG